VLFEVLLHHLWPPPDLPARLGRQESRDSTANRFVINPRWMEETSDIQSGYLPPVPDFASHSPFGGATSWFQLHTAERDSE
jgi:hypothetical protein